MATTSKKKRVIFSLIALALALYAGLVNAVRAAAVPADQGDIGLFSDSVRSKSPKSARKYTPQVRRTPFSSPGGEQQPPFTTSNSTPSSLHSDTCSDLSCTPGMTAFEYLGIGYDIIKGNPRGSFSSELDPGFRSRIMQLDFNRGYLTTDHKYKVPFGTELRRSSSCKFSSSSVEVSSTSDYQKQLFHEAESSESLKVNGKVEGEVGDFGGEASFGVDKQFSRSQKYEEFSQARSSEQTTTFEAKALCTEFTAAIHPDAPPDADASFITALNKLPMPFDNNTDTTVEAYSHFFSTYGTHYVSYVVLGAKHIYSTVMKALDAMELSKKNIDVKSALSLQVQAEVKASYGVGKAEGGTEVGQDSSSSDAEKSEIMKEIKKKIERVDEINVGGVPPADNNWKTWAASVIDRPMPIVYKLTGIWEMMSDDSHKKALFDAMEFLYNIKRNPKKIDTQILDSFHFGVSGPDGTLITDYSYSSNFKYRALVQVDDSNLKSPSDSDQSFISYDIVWDGQTQSAVFATSIYNILSPSYDDMEESPIWSPSDTSYYTPFGLYDDAIGQASIQFANYFRDINTVLERKEMDMFSFLTATFSSDKKIVSGLVHPKGFTVNKNFDNIIQFDVSKPDKFEWLIEFVEEFEKKPTLILFPVWFPPVDDPKLKPSTPKDVFVMTRGCTTKQCTLKTGGSGVNAMGRFYPTLCGFSFLAIDGNLTDVTGVVHGIVDVKTDIPWNQKGVFKETNFTRKQPGYTESITFVDVGEKVKGGVKIVFDKEFAGIPSVIASIHEADLSRLENPAQSVIVDHITTKSAFIKVHINGIKKQQVSLTDGKPIDAVGPEDVYDFSRIASFSFIAVGPVDAMRN